MLKNVNAAKGVTRPQPNRKTISRQEEQQSYYDRLKHQCRKDLNKHAKVTKNFEIKKLIRKIKEGERKVVDTVAADDGNTAKQVAKQGRKLQTLKVYALEPVLQECCRRLGLHQLDPKLQNINAIDVSVVSIGDSAPCGAQDENKLAFAENLKGNCPPDDNSWILERILHHKSMVVALESWNDQITEYRRWCLRQQERLEGVVRENSAKKEKKSAAGEVKISKGDPLGIRESLFVILGGAARADEEDGTANEDPLAYYGPAGNSEVKKNRKGQRARRAKVVALAAKREGRTINRDESLNWRQSKAQRNDHEHDGRPGLQRGHQDISPSPSPPEHLHPSWQARKEQKEGIVAFQGTKITFGSQD